MTAAALAELLRDSTDLVAGPLRAEVATLPEQVRPVVAHHFGWRGPHDPHGALGGGKAVRPALVLLSAAAAGAPLEVAVPGAVAVELVHTFSLLHDDVMDGDRSWRHRPSAWVVFGERLALLAGSALLVRSQVCVLSAPSGPAAARRLERTVQDLIEGQALDLALESSGDASFDLWLRMAERKTAALVSTSAALGAVLGEGPGALVDALSSFGRAVGLAYQALDDLLGIWGDPLAHRKAHHLRPSPGQKDASRRHPRLSKAGP